MILITLIYFGQYPYIRDPSVWNFMTSAFFATFGYQTFLIGIVMILIPALVGKASFIRWFFGGEIWMLPANVSFEIYCFAPLMSLFCFCGILHSVYIAHQTMFYYFIGNMLYILIFSILFFIFVDRPFKSLFYLK